MKQTKHSNAERSPKAWQRHLKQRGWAQDWEFFALCNPALHSALEGEIKASLGLSVQRQENGLRFRGRLELLYLSHIHLRSCSRLFLRFELRAAALEELYRNAAKIPWEFFINPSSAQNTPPQIYSHTRKSRLSHPSLAARTLREAIIKRSLEQGQDAGLDTPNSADHYGARIHLFIEGYRAQILLDASGVPLHLHGYRSQSGEAGLREDLAAGIISHYFSQRMQAPQFIIDGMTGSGTLLIEALLHLHSLPARKLQTYDFEQWPLFRPSTWAYLRRQAQAATTSTPEPAESSEDKATSANEKPLQAVAIDLSATQLAACKHNSQEGGFHRWAQLETLHQDFFEYQPPPFNKKDAAAPLLLLNPPYGKRIGKQSEARQVYAKLTEYLPQQYAGWDAIILVPEFLGLTKDFLPSAKRLWSLRLRHGGLWVRVIAVHFL